MPLVAIVNGRMFAGNTALVACSDVIIATEGSTLGMGGPAMIEGGGLGVYTPEEVGPMSSRSPTASSTCWSRTRTRRCDVAKKYLSYFQGAVSTWEAPDQRRLRHAVPENRLRLYDMRAIVDTSRTRTPCSSCVAKFGIGIITAFIRVEGRPMGVIANNPHAPRRARSTPTAPTRARASCSSATPSTSRC